MPPGIKRKPGSIEARPAIDAFGLIVIHLPAFSALLPPEIRRAYPHCAYGYAFL